MYNFIIFSLPPLTFAIDNTLTAKNVKSVVWPPPNPPEDETPLPNSSDNVPTELSRESASISSETISRKATSESKIAKDQTVSGDQFISTSQETAFSSSVSFSSASTSAATTASSFSKSLVQSEQSQMTRELSSCTVQSFSEQASSEGKINVLYQSQAPCLVSFIPTTDGALMDQKLMHEETELDSKRYEIFKPSSSIIDTGIMQCKDDTQLLQFPNTQNTRHHLNTNITETKHSSIHSKENRINETRQELNTFSDVKKGNDAITRQSTLESATNNCNTIETVQNISHLQKSHDNKEIPQLKTAQKCQQSEPNPCLNQTQPSNFETKSHTITSKAPKKENYVSTMPPETLSDVQLQSKCPTMSPMVNALTTIPDQPFTPVKNICTINEKFSKEATSCDELYGSFNLIDKGFVSRSDIQCPDTKEPMNMSFGQTEYSNVHDLCNNLQSSSQISAFKPVGKYSNQKLSNYISQNSLKSQQLSTNSQHSAFTTSVNTQGISSVKSTQSYFEHLDKHETFSSATVVNSGLQEPVDFPTYYDNHSYKPQFKKDETLEPIHVSTGLQEPFIPVVNPANRLMDKCYKASSTSPSFVAPSLLHPIPKVPAETPMQDSSNLKKKTRYVSMPSQPVSDENILQGSPPRSRPSTPSLINKPAPIIPHYQMNLATVEYYAPESHVYQPSAGEGSRTPTPKLRPRTPSQGSTFKAQAPRIKDYAQHSYLSQNQPFSHQLPSTFQQDLNLAQTDSRINETKQPLVKEEQRSNVERQSESYKEGNMSIKKDTMLNQNYGQRQMETQNVAEYGKTTVQTTKKTFEEYERTQSAKMIEIKKGASMSSDSCQPIEAFIRPSAINSKKTLPSSAMSFTPATQSFSSNLTNENVDTTRQTHKTAFDMSPSISGANRGPVCDPTPSTGSSVGAAARGKTFGVSSAPKRGRGVLNKAVLPGSRVPLCGSCNGNIRGPFITALGRIWCPEHFICVNATCRRPLQDIGFVEENGQLYCEFCFEQYIAPSCDKCHAKIKGDCLNAIGKHFHPECFSCVYCGKLFGNNPFFLEDGLPYCEADWNELFTTKCFACGFPVEAGDRWVEALNNNYHSQCFNCTVCKKNLEGQSFFAKGGRPFCKIHAR